MEYFSNPFPNFSFLFSKTVAFFYSQVNIAQGASISLKGLNGVCGSSSGSCRAHGGSGGIFQIISDSGYIAPDTIILKAGPGGVPKNGFLYIKGKDQSYNAFLSVFVWITNHDVANI